MFRQPFTTQIRYSPSKYTYRSNNIKIDSKHLVKCITCHPDHNYSISKKQMRINSINQLNNGKALFNQQKVKLTQTKPLFQQFTSFINQRLQPTNIFGYPQQKKKTRTQNFFNQINSLYNAQQKQQLEGNSNESNEYCQKQVRQIIQALEKTKTMQTMLQQCQNKKLDWQQAIQETMQILNQIK